MKIDYHRQFTKHFKQRIASHSTLLKRFNARVDLFVSNPKHPILRDHALIGEKIGYRAFSITSDIRLIYLPINNETVRFYDIGTHNQVY
jgi:addiction module RelE/StbE family toxin